MLQLVTEFSLSLPEFSRVFFPGGGVCVCDTPPVATPLALVLAVEVKLKISNES